jgi:predicted MFS family arabinose efflux permease
MALSALVWNSFGLFLLSIEAAFDAPRAAVAMAFSIFALAGALSAPLVGVAFGRWGSRRVLVSLSALMGACLVATAAASGVWTIWISYGVVGGVASHAFGSYVVFMVMARRFRRRPATAMAVADAGSGLSVFLVLPLLEQGISAFGWRATYMAIAVVMATAGILLHAFVLDAVRPPAALPAGGLGQAVLLRPRLLVLALAFLCGSGAYQGLMTSHIALMAEHGIPLDTAATVAAVGGLAIFLWRLVCGWLCDRWSMAGVMVLAAVAGVSTFVALGAIMAGAPLAGVALWSYPVTLGIAFGGTQIILAVAAMQLSTADSYPVVYGVGRLASGLGMAIGPLLAAAAHDATADHGLAMTGLAGATALHFAGFVWTIRRATRRTGNDRGASRPD